MDNSGEGSQAREQPGSGPTPAPEPMCSCIPQEPLDVPGLHICDAQPSLKHLTESFAWGRIIPMSAAAPPCLQQLRLHGEGVLWRKINHRAMEVSLFSVYLIFFFIYYYSFIPIILKMKCPCCFAWFCFLKVCCIIQMPTGTCTSPKLLFVCSLSKKH